MSRNEKILFALWLLLFISVTIPLLPDTYHLRFYVGAGRPITIIEYIQNIILAVTQP